MNFSPHLNDHLSTECLLGMGLAGLYLCIKECRECRKKGESRLYQLSFCSIFIAGLFAWGGLAINTMGKILSCELLIRISAVTGSWVLLIMHIFLVVGGSLLMYDSYIKLKRANAPREKFWKLYFDIALCVVGIIISTLAFNGITPSTIKAWWKTF